MKKLLLMFFLLPMLNLYSVEPPDSISRNCGFDKLLDSQLLDTGYLNFTKRLNFYINKLKQNGLNLPEFEKPKQQDMMLFSSSCDTCYSTQSLYLIPVVVHIVHAPEDSVIGTGSNISNEQVLNAVMVLNKIF